MLHNTNVTVEWVVERFRFTCLRCDTWWDEDYEVRVDIGAEGVEQARYRRGGSRCEAPLAADTPCPACPCGTTYVSRLAHHLCQVTVAGH